MMRCRPGRTPRGGMPGPSAGREADVARPIGDEAGVADDGPGRGHGRASHGDDAESGGSIPRSCQLGSPARLARLHPDCPTRPLDWRWLKAGLMLELGLRWSRRRDDGPTREAKSYRAALG